MVDRPDYPIGDLIALTDRIKDLPPEQKKARNRKVYRIASAPHPRLSLGRSHDKSVALKFKDVDGHDRIVIEVAADGSPAIRFLDQNGKVVSQLPRSGKMNVGMTGGCGSSPKLICIATLVDTPMILLRSHNTHILDRKT